LLVTELRQGVGGSCNMLIIDLRRGNPVDVQLSEPLAREGSCDLLVTELLSRGAFAT